MVGGRGEYRPPPPRHTHTHHDHHHPPTHADRIVPVFTKPLKTNKAKAVARRLFHGMMADKVCKQLQIRH